MANHSGIIFGSASLNHPAMGVPPWPWKPPYVHNMLEFSWWSDRTMRCTLNIWTTHNDVACGYKIDHQGTLTVLWEKLQSQPVTILTCGIIEYPGTCRKASNHFQAIILEIHWTSGNIHISRCANKQRRLARWTSSMTLSNSPIV